MQTFLGHRVRECGTVREPARGVLRLFEQLGTGNDLVVVTPGQSFLGAHAAPGVEQLRGSPLPDDARQDRAGPHVAAGQAHAHEQESGLALGSTVAQVARHGDDGARTGAYAIDRGDDWLRAGAHLLDQVSGHAGEVHQARHVHFDQRTDDVVNVAAGAKVASFPGKDDRAHVVDVLQLVEGVSQLGVALEGERILALRPVEGDGGDTIGNLPLEVLRAPLGGFQLVHACLF